MFTSKDIKQSKNFTRTTAGRLEKIKFSYAVLDDLLFSDIFFKNSPKI